MWLETMVVDITEEKKITAINRDGIWEIKTKAIIFPQDVGKEREEISEFYARPAGIYTAGTAQKISKYRRIPSRRKILILGSGDIGLIMARRLKWEGAEVIGVVEKLPYPGGLTRNLVQCLEDYNIPLYLKHTVVEILGKDRVEGVYIAPVDDNGNPIIEDKNL